MSKPKKIEQMQMEELVSERERLLHRFMDKHADLFALQPAEQVGSTFYGPIIEEGWLFVRLSVDAGDGQYILQTVLRDGMTVDAVSSTVASLERRWAQMLMRRNGGEPDAP